MTRRLLASTERSWDKLVIPSGCRCGRGTSAPVTAAAAPDGRPGARPTTAARTSPGMACVLKWPGNRSACGSESSVTGWPAQATEPAFSGTGRPGSLAAGGGPCWRRRTPREGWRGRRRSSRKRARLGPPTAAGTGGSRRRRRPSRTSPGASVATLPMDSKVRSTIRCTDMFVFYMHIHIYSRRLVCTVVVEGRTVDGEDPVVAANVAKRAVNMPREDPAAVATQELHAPLWRDGISIPLDHGDDIVVE
jgi:hypothetical protein